ncbi:hypothetical protein HYPSUDRAFT_209426 [Hypholoma sublateritium FD-334 SS-4]|uniref:Uncharacterized protein n=1 Tax=Hypholoma sublateritium (strain FD-334 SS-4) TaxID=945553 RepID=A0A0D2N2T2_HYPSF|nr:hypothetical protein HYPSUDRAFT_209426 [Hypholoma sublateritium FD-334 SS-4]
MAKRRSSKATKTNKGKSKAAVSFKSRGPMDHRRLTYKQAGVSTTTTATGDDSRTDYRRIITGTRTYFDENGDAVKALKLIKDTTTTAIVLFDRLADADDLSDISEFELEGAKEVPLLEAAHAETPSFDIKPTVRSPAPFPMSPPSSAGVSDNKDGFADCSEDEGWSEGFSNASNYNPPPLKGPRSDYVFFLPRCSEGSTSSARTTVRRYVGSAASAANAVAPTVSAAPAALAGSSATTPYGSFANPIVID